MLTVAVPKETVPGETRVALVPETIPRVAPKGVQVVVQAGAGEASRYRDSDYRQKGAAVEADGKALVGRADVVLKVQPPTLSEVELLKEGSTLISTLYPLARLDVVRRLASRKVTAFAMELMPRISRAQPMDVLSSQSTVAGYKAVLMAADSLPKFFPMLMTAAGTIPPARVFVIGAGVAGLQAIATSRRLGAVVEAYDVRPVVKEQIESLGAKYVNFAIEAKDAQDAGGYAKAQGEEFYQKQREFMAKTCAASDVVVTTALIPGQKAPLLITEDAVKGMRSGSVVVDLAAEQGGNCALTEPGKTVVKHGVTIHGLLNLPATLGPHASQMYSRNVAGYLLHLLKDGQLHLDLKDEMTRSPLVTHEGKVLHEGTRSAIEKQGGGA